MKKFLVVLLALVMIFTLAACGNEKGNEDLGVYTNYTVDLGDNIPSVLLEGVFTAGELVDGVDYETVYNFVNVDEDANMLAFAVYKWKSEKSLLEDAQSSANEDYANQDYLSVIEYDEWYSKGDYNYVYYAAADRNKYKDKIVYSQHYFFQDGEDIVELEYTMNSYEVPVMDGVTFFAPAVCKPMQLSNTEISNFAISKGYDYEEDFPGYVLYYTDNEFGLTVKDMANAVIADCACTEFEEYEFTSPETGKKYSAIYAEHLNDVDGVDYAVGEYFLDINGKLLSLSCFEYGNDYDQYSWCGADAMSFGFMGF